MQAGEAYQQRLDFQLLQLQTLNHQNLTGTFKKCERLKAKYHFATYMQDVYVFNNSEVTCSKDLGSLNKPLPDFLSSLVNEGQHVVIAPPFPQTGNRPTIILIERDPQTGKGSATIVDGEYIENDFKALEFRKARGVFLEINGQRLPVNTLAETGQVIIHSKQFGYDIHLLVSPEAVLHTYRDYLLALFPLTAVLSLFLAILVWKYISERHTLVDDIERGITNREFFLVYQPIFQTATNTITGVEVLVRWQHPKLGLVSPDLFICMAEKHGLIIPLTDYILKVARQELGSLHFDQSFHVGVNVAPSHLTDVDPTAYFTRYKKAFLRRNMHLCIEVTERQFLNESAAHTISALQEAGVEVAIDDFGTGQTSLSVFPKISVDYLKIDKCFIDTIGQESVNSHVLEGIIALGKKMNFALIAEGVETSDQAAYLVNQKVDYLQGYLIAKPLRIRELKNFLKRNEKQLRIAA
ncbi:cyclic diguanylate phosphodiesterase [Parasalinivibrio latis]|uniref:EAL domain-containing protein n=1 Tax=Parasalinivibrio latis TaxID=2952610 RepID=UPI0030E4ED05